MEWTHKQIMAWHILEHTETHKFKVEVSELRVSRPFLNSYRIFNIITAALKNPIATKYVLVLTLL